MNTVGSAGLFHVASDVSELNTFIKPLPLQVADVMTAYSAALQITSLVRKLENIILDSSLNHAQKLETLRRENRIIDVSMFDNAIATVQMPLTISLNGYTEMAAEGKGLLAGAILGYNIYPTKEGLLAIACLESHFWKNFIVALDKEEDRLGISTGNMAPLKSFASPQYLFSNDQVVKSRIDQVLSSRTAEEWEHFFTAQRPHNKLPITKIRKLTEVDNKLLEARNLLSHHANGSVLVKNGLDYTSLLKTESQHESKEEHNRGPKLGEHNLSFASKL